MYQTVSRMYLVLGLVTVLVTGCASAPRDPENFALAAANEANSKGIQAYKQSEPARALGYFQRAMDIFRSIDNKTGIYTSAINLTKTYRLNGAHDASRTIVMQLLDGPRYSWSAEQEARLRLELAVAYLYLGATDEAAAEVSIADKSCGKICPDTYAIMNVYAHIALRKGQIEVTLAQTRAALEAPVIEANLAERANSFRLQAQAFMRSGMLMEALAAGDQALTIDKQMGLSARVIEDLDFLAAAYEAHGKPENATLARARAAEARAGFQKRKLGVATGSTKVP
jgi:hypothetical protein